MDAVLAQINKAFEVMTELFPFLLYRLGVYGAFGLAMLVYWCVALALCTIAYKLWETAGTILFLIFLGGNYGLITVCRGYFLYMVKAGYVAVLTRIVTQGTLPPGVTQTEYARQMVTKRFKEASAMSIMDQLVKGVIHSFNATLEEISTWLPIPGLNQVVAAVNAIVRLAGNTIDEAVLSLTFMNEDRSVWEAAREGVLLYAQNWKPILQIAAAVVLLDWAMTGLMFVMLLVIVGLPAIAIIPTRWTLVRALAAIIPFLITYVLRVALVEPLGLTAVLLTFHKSIKGQKVDPEWDAKLDVLSSHYRDLKARAQKAL